MYCSLVDVGLARSGGAETELLDHQPPSILAKLLSQPAVGFQRSDLAFESLRAGTDASSQTEPVGQRKLRKLSGVSVRQKPCSP